MGRVSLLPEGEQQQLGRYQLVGQIAAGGMASVYLARIAGVGGFQRFFAIKRLHPHLAEEPEFVEMFLDEARLAASIHHRNAVPILEIGTSSAGYYLVMEYIEGVTLARLMTQAAVLKEPVPRPVLLRIVVDTLSGLGAAHQQRGADGEPMGIVHRDCSPQNILVGLDGCTRITDFGIARASSRIHTTRAGAMKGKLAYMAPEQTQGEDFDLRADLFSVAVVLFELLSGLRLFKTQSEAQTLRRLLHEPIPRLSKVMDDIHPSLEAVCVKGLMRNPDERYQTAAEMADAIESAARAAAGDGEPIATERTVEALMKERYGQDVDEQHEAVRQWLAATPTLLGRLGKATQRGWLGPAPADGKASADEAWVTSSAERPVVPSGEVPAGGVPSSAPHTDRRWPTQPPGERASQEDETHVYDPTSTAGASGPASALPRMAHPSTKRSEQLELPMAGGKLRWLLAAAVALIMVVVGVWALGDRPDDDPPLAGSATGEGRGDPPAPAVDRDTPPETAATAPSAKASGPAPASSTTAVPTAVETGSPTKAKGPSTATPPSKAEPPPKVEPPPKPPPKGPGDDEDLANPYR